MYFYSNILSMSHATLRELSKHQNSFYDTVVVSAGLKKKTFTVRCKADIMQAC
jgi:hypothetical protein